MPLFSVRTLVPFVQGENDTDVIINGVHFNRTALGYFNYTLYSNGTLSNGTECWLSFDLYQPRMLMNGTFINGTSCYSPIFGLGSHGITGIAFAAMFAALVMFTLVNLRKHGKAFLPREKRSTAVGRRWMWYWLLFVETCGLIGCLMSIDVDRDYVQSIPLILQSLFFYLLLPGLMASVWEGVRRWGIWQERQIFDRDALAFSAQSTREKQEFWIPLIFYLFAWTNFFLVILRSWTPIQLQRSPEQQNFNARPAATDVRFKAAGFLAAAGLVVICYGLGHSIYRYYPRPAGVLRRKLFYLHAAPDKFKITIILLAVKIGYTVASSFEWAISPLNFNVNSGWIYGLGYTPPLLIVIVFNVYGYIESNEDEVLIAQRAERNHNGGSELCVERKEPSWWRKMRPDYRPSAVDERGRIRSHMTEIGGGRPTQRNLERYIELGNIHNTHYMNDFDGHGGTQRTDHNIDIFSPSSNMADRWTSGDRRSVTTERLTGSSNASIFSNTSPQYVKSMLDI